MTEYLVTGGTSLSPATQGVPGVAFWRSTPFVPQGVPPNCQVCSFAGPKP
jgi:hypothetical protein